MTAEEAVDVRTKEHDERAAALQDAQNKAVEFFKEIGPLIKPGVGEKELSQKIHQLGNERHGVRTHWHKRVIRSGPNTLRPFQEDPPDRIIEEGDMVYVDLGPVFESWEADFGRTYVLGDDENKKKLRDALEPAFIDIKAHYRENPDMTGEELYNYSCEYAKKHGWTWGAQIAGHIIGDFPHERIPNDKITLYITPGNKEKMSDFDKKGHRRHWILEVHLHDPENGNGGFYEQLLTVDA